MRRVTPSGNLPMPDTDETTFEQRLSARARGADTLLCVGEEKRFVGVPHPDDPKRTLFSRDCPIYHLRTRGVRQFHDQNPGDIEQTGLELAHGHRAAQARDGAAVAQLMAANCEAPCSPRM